MSGPLLPKDRYDATIATMFFWYGSHWARKRTPPRFALARPDVTIFASLGDVGHLFVRNDSARELVDLWCEKCRDSQLAAPTYLMLRAFCDTVPLEADELTIEELGLVAMAGMPKPSRGGDA